MTEETPSCGTEIMPQRRATDACPHMGRHVKYQHPKGVTLLYTIAQYLVISASISVLLMTWHIFQTVKRLESATIRLEPIMIQQNSIMQDIHHSIHAEGEALRATVRK